MKALPATGLLKRNDTEKMLRSTRTKDDNRLVEGNDTEKMLHGTCAKNDSRLVEMER